MVKCQVCGYKTISEYGSYEICDVCFWEDDGLYEDPDLVRVGPNGGLSLTQARNNYQEFGAVEKKFINDVRKPTPSEMAE
jgi:hypothetical protein